MSKGSSSRPFSVTNEEYATRWDAIFGKDNEKKNDQKEVGSTESDRSCDSGSSNNPEGQAGQAQNP